MSEKKINISVNGEPKNINQQLTLSKVLNELSIDKQMISIAVNSDYVAKDQYDSLTINENDLIDILTPIAGG
ncbi:MAG: sulfur carrier protein ThiS [Saccharospirillaceae bacterium]|nr:sulfur carrier protein ThiS [Pseudomonadales bacterium]NRB79395.1 sulfur carrier protein ThiS [Saccharospirillaceae bacterium]